MTQMTQMTQIMFRVFLKLVIGRNYLYLPTEIIKREEPCIFFWVHENLALRFLKPFPCAGLHVMAWRNRGVCFAESVCRCRQ